MSRVLIRKVNDEMPHARLYLDDIQEVEGILRRMASAYTGASDIDFQYQVDQETLLTEFADLAKHAGFSPYFSLEMVSRAEAPRLAMTGTILHFSKHMRPRVSLPSAMREQLRGFASEVEQVFRRRQDKIKTYSDLLSTPVWISLFSTSVFCSVCILDLLIMRIGYHYWASNPRWLYVAVPTALLLPTFFYAERRRNGVYLCDSRPTELARGQARKELWSKVAWLALTTIVGVLTTLFVAKITGHLK